MLDELENYESKGHFFFSAGDELAEVCNAPEKGIGVFIVYALKDGKIELIYTGSAGKISQNGSTEKRTGGICNGLVNGKQFGKPRRVSWKEKLIAEKIEALDIYWYVTFDEHNSDIPAAIEGLIMQRYFDAFRQLPKWNTEF